MNPTFSAQSVWRSPAALAVCCLWVGGCNGSAHREMLGVWIGKPDTSSARAQRDMVRFGGDSSTLPEAGTGVAAGALADEPTDWEQYDVQIRIEFVDRQRLTLQLNDGPSISADWRMIETGPAGLVIELATMRDGAVADGVDARDADQKGPSIVRRRFELLTDRQGDRLQGFTMSEVGADRRLGALYFQRAAKEY